MHSRAGRTVPLAVGLAWLLVKLWLEYVLKAQFHQCHVGLTEAWVVTVKGEGYNCQLSFPLNTLDSLALHDTPT